MRATWVLELSTGRSGWERTPRPRSALIRGHVRDEHGSPVEGAAIVLGEQMVFSNAAGEFSLRLTKPQQMPLTVATQEFLSPLHFTVVFAPSTVTAASEESATDVLIVLRAITNNLR